MSLTSLLRQPDSFINSWIAKEVPHYKVINYVRNMNDSLSRVSRIADYNCDPSLMGTAFDYAFRLSMDKLYIYHLVAYNGVNSELEFKALTSMLDKANECHSEDDDKNFTDYITDIAKVSIALAWFERIFRSGDEHQQLIEARNQYDMNNSSSQDVIKVWEKTFRPFEIDDIKNLITESVKTFSAEKSIIREHVRSKSVQYQTEKSVWVQNPKFDLSHKVGGADGDWIIDGVLYDSKCSWKRKPATKDMIYQVILYELLNEHIRIESVALYFPRHNTRFIYSLRDFWDGDNNWHQKRKSLHEAVSKHYGDLIAFDISKGFL